MSCHREGLDLDVRVPGRLTAALGTGPGEVVAVIGAPQQQALAA